MNISKYIFSFLTLFSFLHMSVSAEEEKPWNISFDTGYYSKYIWRGLDIVGEEVLQPSFTLGYKDFSATIWANMEMTSENESAYGADPSGEFTEVDLSLDWARSFDMVQAGAGIIYYSFPNTGANSTTELYFSAGLDTILNPTVSVYFDVDSVDGTYSTFSLGHSFSEIYTSDFVSISCDLGAYIGHGSQKYNNSYYSVDESKFSNYQVSVAFPMQFDEYISFSAHAQYDSLMSSEIREQREDEDNFTVGVSFNYSI